MNSTRAWGAMFDEMTVDEFIAAITNPSAEAAFERARAEMYFDTLSGQGRARLLQNWQVYQWFVVRQALAELNAGGTWGLYQYYLSQPDPAQEAIDDDPDLSQYIQYCDNILALKEWFLDPNRPEGQRLDAWDQLDDQQRQDLIAIDDWFGDWAAYAAQLDQDVEPAVDRDDVDREAAEPLVQPDQDTEPAVDWVDWDDVDRHNGSMLAGMDDGQKVMFVQAEDRLWIGNDVCNPVASLPSFKAGAVSVTKQDPDAKEGAVTAQRCLDQEGFMEAIGRIPEDVFAVTEVTFA